MVNSTNPARSILILAILASAGTAAETVSISAVVSPYMGDGLELAVVPWPQEAELNDRMLVATRVEVETPANYDYPCTVQVARELFAAEEEKIDAASPAPIKLYLGEIGNGGPADKLLKRLTLIPDARKQQSMGDQGYVLYVGKLPQFAAGVIVVAGTGPAGTYYGLQSLRQLTVPKGGKSYVRMGRIADWPVMAWRGSKRPRRWEERYKANYGYLPAPMGGQQFRIYPAGGSDPQRELKSWELERKAGRSASRGLDCSDRMIGSIMQRWTKAFRSSGQHHFTLKGDDIELALDERSGTRARFANDCGKAFVYLLTKLNQRLKRLDPRCTLYWMPNSYYTVNWDFERLSRQVRLAGGVPSDVGLWWTGHYVFSGIMTAEDISGYQRAFCGDNPIHVKGLIYDNHGRAQDYGGRADDFFPMPRRDPDIAKHLMGLSNERGSAINRITSYDFQWNPNAYDPERSLKLAVRELTGRDPEYYRAALDFVRTWEAGRYPPVELTTHAEVVRQQRTQLQKLTTLGQGVEAAGRRVLQDDTSTMNRDGGFRRHFLNRMLQCIKMKQACAEFLPHMWRDGNAPAYVIDAEGALDWLAVEYRYRQRELETRRREQRKKQRKQGKRKKR